MSLGELAGIAGLGAFHGINPAMGWLFAVALGLQERSRAAVVGALGPIAAGHAVSIALTVAVVEGLRGGGVAVRRADRRRRRPGRPSPSGSW